MMILINYAKQCKANITNYLEHFKTNANNNKKSTKQTPKMDYFAKIVNDSFTIFAKITNLLGTTPDEVPRFITKKQIQVHDQSGNAEDRYKPSKQTRFKTSMLRSDLCDFSDSSKGTITITKTDGRRLIDVRNRLLVYKTTHHLLIAYQRSIMY